MSLPDKLVKRHENPDASKLVRGTLALTLCTIHSQNGPLSCPQTIMVNYTVRSQGKWPVCSATWWPIAKEGAYACYFFGGLEEWVVLELATDHRTWLSDVF